MTRSRRPIERETWVTDRVSRRVESDAVSYRLVSVHYRRPHLGAWTHRHMEARLSDGHWYELSGDMVVARAE